MSFIDFLERVKLLFGGKSYEGISTAINAMKETVNIVMENQENMKQKQKELEDEIRKLKDEITENSVKMMETIECIHTCPSVVRDGLNVCPAWKRLMSKKIKRIVKEIEMEEENEEETQ